MANLNVLPQINPSANQLQARSIQPQDLLQGAAVDQAAPSADFQSQLNSAQDAERAIAEQAGREISKKQQQTAIAEASGQQVQAVQIPVAQVSTPQELSASQISTQAAPQNPLTQTLITNSNPTAPQQTIKGVDLKGANSKNQKLAQAPGVEQLSKGEPTGIQSLTSNDWMSELNIHEIETAQQNPSVMAAEGQKSLNLGQGDPLAPKGASSSLSTDDFINLRTKSFLKKSDSLPVSSTLAGGGAEVAMLKSVDGSPMPLATVDAPVTTGHMMRPVLSHDAVHQLSNQMALMNQVKQNGEIRIRLRPDHLGELSMSIKNQGSAISVKIQAQDAEAKQILESSLSSLRESLSQQNLSVARFEITQAPVATTQAQTDGGAMASDFGSFQRQQSDVLDQQRQQHDSNRETREWGSDWGRDARVDSRTSGFGPKQTSVSRNGGAERLDLIA